MGDKFIVQDFFRFIHKSQKHESLKIFTSFQKFQKSNQETKNDFVS